MPEPPSLHHKKGQDNGVSFSSNALIDLLSAVHEKGGDFRFMATGSSMYPTIREGDIITISPLKGITPVFGDIVAFRHPNTGKMVVHRIIDGCSDIFLAQGDNVPDVDGLVPLANLLGVITRVERDGSPLFWPDIRSSPGRARIFFRTQYGLLKLKKSIFSMGMAGRRML